MMEKIIYGAEKIDFKLERIQYQKILHEDLNDKRQT